MKHETKKVISKFIGLVLLVGTVGGGIYYFLMQTGLLTKLLPEEASPIGVTIEATLDEVVEREPERNSGSSPNRSGEPVIVFKNNTKAIPSNKPAYYKWVDSNGVVHFTNNPSTLPVGMDHNEAQVNVEEMGGLLSSTVSAPLEGDSGGETNLAIGGVKKSDKKSELPSLINKKQGYNLNHADILKKLMSVLGSKDKQPGENLKNEFKKWGLDIDDLNGSNNSEALNKLMGLVNNKDDPFGSNNKNNPSDPQSSEDARQEILQMLEQMQNQTQLGQ